MHLLKHIVGYTLPVILFLIVFFYVGDLSFTAHSVIKTTGVAALFLFGLIFIIGPIPRFWHDLSPWKVFRPYWAKWAVLMAVCHMILAYFVSYRADIIYMFSRENPRLIAALLGLFAVTYFIFMVVISERHIRTRIGPLWKKFHVFGYAAFAAALFHFFLVNNTGGHFMLGRFLEQALFAFAVIVLVLRGYVAIWAWVDKSNTPTPVSSSNSNEVPNVVETPSNTPVPSSDQQNARNSQTNAPAVAEAPATPSATGEDGFPINNDIT